AFNVVAQGRILTGPQFDRAVTDGSEASNLFKQGTWSGRFAAADAGSTLSLVTLTLTALGLLARRFQRGSGLIAPGLAKNKSPLAVSLLGPLPDSKKRSQFFNRAVSAR